MKVCKGSAGKHIYSVNIVQYFIFLIRVDMLLYAFHY
jgi:hypothetical protein